MKKILAFLILTGILSAQEVNTGLTFLKLGVGSRSIAMGEAYTAVATDNSSLFYNPAASRFSTSNEVMLMHKEWIAGTTTEYLGATVLGESFSYGFSALSTSVSDIEVRTMPGSAAGTFNAQNISLGFSTAYSFDDNFAIGVAGKFLYEKIFIDEASGYGIDIGGLYTYSDDIMFGASILNVGSMNELRSQSTALPTTVRLGIAYKTLLNEDYTFATAGDAVKTIDDNVTHFHIGIESTYDNLLSVRAGYKTGYETTSFSAGFGIQYGIVNFDYAFVPFTEGFSSTHTFSLSFEL